MTRFERDARQAIKLWLRDQIDYLGQSQQPEDRQRNRDNVDRGLDALCYLASGDANYDHGAYGNMFKEADRAGVLKHYLTDLVIHDFHHVQELSTFLWIMRECGTHIWTQDHPHDYYHTKEPGNLFYIWDGEALTQGTPEQARDWIDENC